jgi:hypothetical protein
MPTIRTSIEFQTTLFDNMMETKLIRRVRVALLTVLLPVSCAVFGADHSSINGFRSARFGMDESQVKVAVAKDFPADGAQLTSSENPAEGTHIAVLQLAALEPGPVPATVSYIFGATSKRLIHVNVTWAGAAGATEAERTGIAAAGVQLASYLREKYAQPGIATTGLPDANGVVLFTSTDDRNAAVQLRLSGVPIEGASAPAPGTRARLTLSYVADSRHPDVKVVSH